MRGPFVTTRLLTARPNRLAAVAVVAAALVATAGLTGTPAHAAPDPLACPAAYPVTDLVAGQTISGLTSVDGNQEEQFGGSVLGVLKDGVAPGLDMILVRLDATGSPTLARVGGIWSGMSGSPVYLDGRLVGAVAYSLGTGPSMVAGVTPAEDMEALLSDTARGQAQARQTVAIPRAMASRLVASGAASATDVSSGMHQLKLPFTVGGLSPSRLSQLAPLYKFGHMQVSTGSSGSAVPMPAEIQPGGNLAAAMSWGTVPAAAFGTATMVCGDEVVGFGHPMNFTGPSAMSMHPAQTIVIQDDPTVAGFKVANLGQPVGVVDQDRQAGIHGVTGEVPADYPVSSTATARTTRSGLTHVVVPDVFSEVAFSQMLAIQDRALDRTGGGSGTASWTVTGTHDGTPFTLRRTDMYADRGDISSATAITFAEELSLLEENGDEDVTFTKATTSSTLARPYEKWNISRVDLWRKGRFHRLFDGFPASVRAGHTAILRVHLTSKQLGTTTTRVRVDVPKHARRHHGLLDIVGGDDTSPVDGFYSDGFDSFGDFSSDSGGSVDELLHEFRSAQHHNDIVATLTFPNAPFRASVPRRGKHSLRTVVGGEIMVPVRAVR
jgi:hypothetical protein